MHGTELEDPVQLCKDHQEVTLSQGAEVNQKSSSTSNQDQPNQVQRTQEQRAEKAEKNLLAASEGQAGQLKPEDLER